MLSSIHPFGERARGQRYPVTATAFVLGALAGGLALGSLTALMAWSLSATGVPGAIPALIVLVGAAAWDLSRRPVPSYSRQVDEAWLPRYRGWVYGAGFGFQLGVGFSTYVKTSLTYGFVLAATLLGSPSVALWAGVLFGAVRGLSILATVKTQSPEDLRLLFSRLIASQRLVRVGGASAIVLVTAMAIPEML